MCTLFFPWQMHHGVKFDRLMLARHMSPPTFLPRKKNAGRMVLELRAEMSHETLCESYRHCGWQMHAGWESSFMLDDKWDNSGRKVVNEIPYSRQIWCELYLADLAKLMIWKILLIWQSAQTYTNTHTYTY